MIDLAFLDELNKFNLVVKKRVTSTYSGARKSTAMGRGIMFKEHRIYSAGEDIRDIDWKVFARTDNLYIKTFEEERNLTGHIIVDSSASMNYGKPSKFDYAAQLGVGFAYLAMKENERFQFSTFNDSLQSFQPKRGMGHLMSMVDHLNALKVQGHSKLKECLTAYRKLIGSRSMLYLISDFLIPVDEILESLYMLGDHQINVIQVLDPMEKDLTLQGSFKLKDAETDQKMHTYISPRLQSQYQSMLKNHNSQIEDTCAQLKINFHTCTTDTPIFDVFYDILG